MRICVYTAVFGRYDGLIEPPESDDGVDFICFTDDVELRSERWDIRVVAPAFAQDGVRSARLLKILGHDDLSDYDVVVYIDASVRLLGSPTELVDQWLSEDADIALARHSYRNTLIDEFDEVIRLNYDDRSRVYEQLVHYGLSQPDVLSEQPLWTGILIRRSTPAVRTVMQDWAQHVLRYSRRDQLSLPAVLHGADVGVRVVEVDNFSSSLHEWPVIERRRVAQGKAALVPLGPLVADLRRAYRRVEELQQEIDTLAPARFADLEANVVDLKNQIAAGTAERSVLERRLQDALREAGALQEQLRRQQHSLRASLHRLRRTVAEAFARKPKRRP